MKEKLKMFLQSRHHNQSNFSILFCFVLFSHQNAIKNKVKSVGSGEKRDHWMDYAKKDYDVSSTELVTFFLFTIDYFLMQPYSCFQIISHDNCSCFS